MQLAAGHNPRKALTLPAAATRRPSGGGRESAASAALPPEATPRRAVFSTALPQKAGEVARIEIQTADPNIRIIWLAPQKADEAEPKR
jgi:hypothetical protein